MSPASSPLDPRPSADPYFRLKHARRLVATFPDARLVEIPDARTFVPLDQPERLADEIAAFAPVTG